MMGDCGNCAQNYKWELDQEFRATGDKEVDENVRENILRGIGIPKTAKKAQSEDESSDSDGEEIFDHKVDVLVDPECGYACKNDIGWFDIVQSHAPWDEARRPYDELLMYEELSLTDKEKEGNLSGMVMATGLTVLDSVPMTDGFALTKLQLPDKGLKNIQILDSYKYIQYVDLSHNAIKDLSPLDSLTYLIVLDACHNEVEYFKPNPTPWFLSFLNLSHNKLENIPDISSMWSLKHLNLSNNDIQKIQGIEDLNYLEYVNLSHNAIQVLENISKVPLKTLDVSWNRISRCEDSTDENGGLRNIITLQRLDISHNSLESMDGMKCINPFSLRHLNIAYNNFNCATAFDDLARYKSLRYLRLEENSIVHKLPEIVKNVIHLLPQLAYINGSKLTKSERLAVSSTWNSHPIVKEMKKYCYELLYSNMEPPEYGVETAAHLDYNVPIVIITGPMGTRKYSLVKYIADRYPEYVSTPVVHSTLHNYSDDNSDVCEEFKNLNILHVEESDFNQRWNRGEYVYVHNDMGDLYGLDRNELEDDGRLIIMAVPLQPAFSMMWQGLNTTIILVKPKSEEDYSDLLQRMIVSRTIIRRERDEAKEIQALPRDNSSVSSSYTLAKDEEEENETGTEPSMKDVTSATSLAKKILKRSRDRDSHTSLNEPIEGNTALGGNKKSLDTEPSIKSLHAQSISVTHVDKHQITMARYGSTEYRMTLEMPWWCSDESLGEVEMEEQEPTEKHTSFIETLKTHAGEKERLWTLYHSYYSEAKFYYEDITGSCEHLFARTVVIDDMDRAMKRILPLLVEKYNMSLKPRKNDEKDPLYDVLVEPRLKEMMEILADRGVIGRYETDRPNAGDAMSSEPSKDTLSVPFFSPETSSFEVTPSTSFTEFGSEERKLEEPRHFWAPSSPPTPPDTPSSVLENVARESMKRAGFVTHEADHAIKYCHSHQ